jgi:fatty acid desaturase
MEMTTRLKIAAILCLMVGITGATLTGPFLFLSFFYLPFFALFISYFVSGIGILTGCIWGRELMFYSAITGIALGILPIEYYLGFEGGLIIAIPSLLIGLFSLTALWLIKFSRVKN